MKKYISCDTSNKGRDWLANSKEVDDLFAQMNPREKRIVNKLANSTDPAFYLGVVADMVEVLDIPISESFDTFVRQGLEKL